MLYQMTTAPQANGTTNGAATILNAPILPIADAPEVADLPKWLAEISEQLNAGPTTPDTLATRVYQDIDKDGNVRGKYQTFFSTSHTTTEIPEHLYSAPGAGKNVVSVKEDWTDSVLRDLSLVRGGTRAYLILPWTRDKNGFKKVDQKLAGKFRKAAERLAMSDKAAHHRFDYARFTVLPASDDAPAEIGGYLRIVFTGTRVK